MKITQDMMERWSRETIEVRVEDGNDSILRGTTLATCIRKMEENPGLSAEDALTQVIEEIQENNPTAAAQLLGQFQIYLADLSQAEEAKYLDLRITHVQNGEPGRSYAEARALQEQLTAILDAGRVKIRGVIAGDALSLLDAPFKTRSKVWEKLD